jgi:hypothetical protein
MGWLSVSMTGLDPLLENLEEGRYLKVKACIRYVGYVGVAITEGMPATLVGQERPVRLAGRGRRGFVVIFNQETALWVHRSSAIPFFYHCPLWPGCPLEVRPSSRPLYPHLPHRYRLSLSPSLISAPKINNLHRQTTNQSQKTRRRPPPPGEL